MPGGRYDSSKTRVVPFFEQLEARTDDWVRTLLEASRFGHPACSVPSDLDLTFEKGEWGDAEHGYTPPESLLRWMVSNPHRLRQQTSSVSARRELLEGSARRLTEALENIDRSNGDRSWFVLEGTTYPDAVLTTRDAIVVVEGKRTESGPTTKTSWLDGRHQMWRHIEGAWQVRGTRKVFGIFMVDSPSEQLPAKWQAASEATFAERALESSFPHRRSEEREALARCFRGIITWRAACALLAIDYDALPDTVSGIVPRG